MCISLLSNYTLHQLQQSWDTLPFVDGVGGGQNACLGPFFSKINMTQAMTFPEINIVSNNKKKKPKS